MQFAKHSTFYLRAGWISKAITALPKNPFIFSPINIGEAIDALGIGRAMVASLRYWLDVLELTSESTENSQIRLDLTPLGSSILQNDRYLERKGTLWLIHYKMATAKEKATAWYWFFNHFPYKEFDEHEFLYGLKRYIRNNDGKAISDNSLKKDFRCLINTYIYDQEAELEDIISCPLRELKLLTQSYSKGKRVYRRRRLNQNEVPPPIFYYLILESLSGENTEEGQVSIDDLMFDLIPKSNGEQKVSVNDLVFADKSVGKVLNLTINDVYEFIYSMENLGYVKLHRSFGDNYISILKENKQEVLEGYYNDFDFD